MSKTESLYEQDREPVLNPEVVSKTAKRVLGAVEAKNGKKIMIQYNGSTTNTRRILEAIQIQAKEMGVAIDVMDLGVIGKPLLTLLERMDRSIAEKVLEHLGNDEYQRVSAGRWGYWSSRY